MAAQTRLLSLLASVFPSMEVSRHEQHRVIFSERHNSRDVEVTLTVLFRCWKPAGPHVVMCDGSLMPQGVLGPSGTVLEDVRWMI